MKKLIIFDFDGTLADTSPGIQHCYNATAAAMGYKPHPEREDFFGVIGGSLEHGFAKLCPAMSPAEISRAVMEYRERYAVEGIALPAPLYPQMKETLETLKGQGLKLAVATLKHRRFIRQMMDALEISVLFDAICAYQNGESKRDLLEEACRLTKTPPEESVLVGDSAFDGQGANSFGISFIAAVYGWGFREKRDTEPYSPIAVLHRPVDLLFIKGI